ncbi:MAG: flagellar export protein FliJ [Firmicutes bacterium]|nr:flagellar export protein FliJ [Bacillota bacterium]
MQAFHFSLETLLKVRRIEEEEMQIKLAEASAKVKTEKERLALLNDKLTAHINEYRSKQRDKISVSILNVFHYYNDKLKEDIIDQHSCVDMANKQFQQRLVLLEQAVKARKLVEKLREKRLAEYQAECLAEEQRVIDEQGLQVYSRNK